MVNLDGVPQPQVLGTKTIDANYLLAGMILQKRGTTQNIGGIPPPH